MVMAIVEAVSCQLDGGSTIRKEAPVWSTFDSNMRYRLFSKSSGRDSETCRESFEESRAVSVAPLKAHHVDSFIWPEKGPSKASRTVDSPSTSREDVDMKLFDEEENRQELSSGSINGLDVFMKYVPDKVEPLTLDGRPRSRHLHIVLPSTRTGRRASFVLCKRTGPSNRGSPTSKEKSSPGRRSPCSFAKSSQYAERLALVQEKIVRLKESTDGKEAILNILFPQGFESETPRDNAVVHRRYSLTRQEYEVIEQHFEREGEDVCFESLEGVDAELSSLAFALTSDSCISVESEVQKAVEDLSWQGDIITFDTLIIQS